MTQQKLYTEEQVRDMLHEMKFKHNLTDEHIEYWIEDMNPIEVPSDEEINKQAIAVASYNELMSLQETCKSSGKYLGFIEGAKWMRDKILNK